jgi:hypothetical protein
MDIARLVVLPRAGGHVEADLREVDAAIRLVAQGSAVRIRLVGLADIDRIAPVALARAQEASVHLRVERHGSGVLIFGLSSEPTGEQQ